MSAANSIFVLSDAWSFHHDDVGLGWGLVMMLGMLLFWGLVIYAVVALIRGGGGTRGRQSDPRDVLKRRLASGEITVEEYEQRKSLLDRDAGASPPGQAAPGSG